MKPKTTLLRFLVLAASSLLGISSAHAATTVNWDGDTSNLWTTVGNWDTAPTNNLTANIANFNLASYNGITVFAPTVGTATSINGISISGSNGAMTLTNTAALSIGGSGISIANGAGAFTISGNTTLGAAQSWLNNSSSLCSVGGGTVTNGGFLLTVGGSGGTAISSIISGNGGLTKTDAGSLTLTGLNTYKGVTTVSGGTLAVTGGGQLYYSLNATLANAVTISSGGTIEFDNWGYGGSTGTGGSFGTLYYEKGNLVINGGTLRYVGTTAKGSSNRSFTIGASGATLESATSGVKWIVSSSGSYTTLDGKGGTLTLTGAGDGQIDQIIPGTGGLTKSGNGTWTLNAANGYTGATNVTAGTLQIGNSGSTGSLTGTSSITVGSGANLTINRSDAFTQAAGLNSKPITGDGSFTQAGSGTTTLSATNIYTGTTTATAGALVATKAAALPGYNVAEKVIFNGGTVAVQVGGSNWTTAEADTLLTNATKTSGAFGIDTTNGNLTQWTTFTTTNLGSNLGLTKLGANTLTMDQANTYAGATTATAGVLVATTTAALPGYNLPAKVIFNGGTVAVQVGGSGWATADADTLLTNATKTSGAFGIDTTNGNLTQWTTFTTTNLGSNLGLTKLGANTLTMDQANTYAGATNVNAGVLNIQNATALGTTASGTSVTSGAALEIQGDITVGAEGLTLNGTGISSGGALRNISGTNNYGGTVTLGSATRINSDARTLNLTNTVTNGGFLLTVGGSGNTAISSIISGNGGLTKTDAGGLTLTKLNTYKGVTTVSGGTLAVTGGGQLYSNLNADGTSLVTINSGGTIEFDNWIWGGSFGTLFFKQSIFLINGGTLRYVGTTANGASNRCFTIGANGATLESATSGVKWALTSGTFLALASSGGSLTLTGVGDGQIDVIIPGTGGLTKSGNGTWTLTNSNTYSGATAINQGTLKITGTTQTTHSITFTGGSLGLDTGSHVTASSAAVNLTNGTISVTGSTGAASYTLLTAASITGTPVLAAAVTGYELQLANGNTELHLVQSAGGPYETWAGPGVPFDADANGDGVSNGLAWLLGASGPNAAVTLPTTSQTGGNLVMSFTCLATADRGTATLTLEYDGDLAGTWLSVPVPGAVGDPNPIVETTTTGSVSFVATDGGTNVNGAALINVVATISDATESASGKLFGRVKGTNP